MSREAITTAIGATTIILGIGLKCGTDCDITRPGTYTSEAEGATMNEGAEPYVEQIEPREDAPELDYSDVQRAREDLQRELDNYTRLIDQETERIRQLQQDVPNIHRVELEQFPQIGRFTYEGRNYTRYAITVGPLKQALEVNNDCTTWVQQAETTVARAFGGWQNLEERAKFLWVIAQEKLPTNRIDAEECRRFDDQGYSLLTEAVRPEIEAYRRGNQ